MLVVVLVNVGCVKYSISGRNFGKSGTSQNSPGLREIQTLLIKVSKSS